MHHNALLAICQEQKDVLAVRLGETGLEADLEHLQGRICSLKEIVNSHVHIERPVLYEGLYMEAGIVQVSKLMRTEYCHPEDFIIADIAASEAKSALIGVRAQHTLKKAQLKGLHVQLELLVARLHSFLRSSLPYLQTEVK